MTNANASANATMTNADADADADLAMEADLDQDSNENEICTQYSKKTLRSEEGKDDDTPKEQEQKVNNQENRCGKCKEELGSKDPRTVYKQTAYHPHCFCCIECKTEELSGEKGFYVNEGKKYCVNCYNKKVAEEGASSGQMRKETATQFGGDSSSGGKTAKKTKPIIKPASQPAGQPSSKPASQPGSQPASQPSKPSSQPGSQPASRP